MIEEPIVLRNRLGLHARAAAKLVHVAAGFTCRVALEKDGDEVDAKSILGLLLLAASKGTRLVLRVDGADERAALAAVKDLVERRFDESE